MFRRKKRKDLFDLFNEMDKLFENTFKEMEKSFKETLKHPTRTRTYGYSITVTYNGEGKPIVKVETYGDLNREKREKVTTLETGGSKPKIREIETVKKVKIPIKDESEVNATREQGKKRVKIKIIDENEGSGRKTDG